MSERLLALAAVILLAGPVAYSLESDDVIRLTKAKVGDEVIIAQMQAAKARFVLTADDIVRLKKEGVSDAVLKAMIESAKEQPAKEAPAAAKAGEEPVRSEPRSEAKPEAKPTATDIGLLILENLDSREYSVQVDPENRNVFYYKASAAEGREPLPARSSQVYRLAPGAYRLTWVAGADSHLIKVLPGKESRSTLTRTSADGTEAVYLSLFEDGERRGGGRLKTLADRAPAQEAEAQPAPVTKVVERHYYTVPTQPVYYQAASPARHSGGYDRYDRECGHGTRYNWLVPTFSYDWTRGKNNYAVGWGARGDLGFSWHRQLGRSGYTIGWGW